MPAVALVDTNILLYAVSTARDEEAKAEIARRTLAREDLAVSVQVLQEFYVQATRPGRSDRLTHAQATQLIESWLRFPVQDLTVSVMSVALELGFRHKLSYWDSAVIAAARGLGCRELLTEDLAHGRDYDGVRVVNPFVVG